MDMDAVTSHFFNLESCVSPTKQIVRLHLHAVRMTTGTDEMRQHAVGFYSALFRKEASTASLSWPGRRRPGRQHLPGGADCCWGAGGCFYAPAYLMKHLWRWVGGKLKGRVRGLQVKQLHCGSGGSLLSSERCPLVWCSLWRERWSISGGRSPRNGGSC